MATVTTAIYTLSLHDALPIYRATADQRYIRGKLSVRDRRSAGDRSEEHTSELQSRRQLVCRLLLEKKKLTKTANQFASQAPISPLDFRQQRGHHSLRLCGTRP